MAHVELKTNRFTFASTDKPAQNPWDLLDEPQSDEDTIPVIADDESAQYILKLSLGHTLPLTAATGQSSWPTG